MFLSHAFLIVFVKYDQFQCLCLHVCSSFMTFFETTYLDNFQCIVVTWLLAMVLLAWALPSPFYYGFPPCLCLLSHHSTFDKVYYCVFCPVMHLTVFITAL